MEASDRDDFWSFGNADPDLDVSARRQKRRVGLARYFCSLNPVQVPRLTRRSDGPNDTTKTSGIRAHSPRLRRHFTHCRFACNIETTYKLREGTTCRYATTITKGSVASVPISLEPGMSQSKQFEVAVIGGGISGLTLAIALHHRAIPVTIYEQAPAFGEIGAGVSFSPNAVQAMDICCTGITEAYNRVCTKNMWPSKQRVWFDYLDGHADSTDKAAFTISNELGQNGVHRARFLDNLVKLLPREVARFGKRLSTVTALADGKQEMTFEDGSRAQADAIIGCDGIKSRVRQIMFGATSPFAKPSYTFKYAYRGLVAMHDAVGAIGEERAQNACMHVSSCILVFVPKLFLTATDGSGRTRLDIPRQRRRHSQHCGVQDERARLARFATVDSASNKDGALARLW
jgi:hypothetical protein